MCEECNKKLFLQLFSLLFVAMQNKNDFILPLKTGMSLTGNKMIEMLFYRLGSTQKIDFS